MLSYYEEMGLLKSSRRANASAYRVYDEDAVKRLQQIIILRKLQIPVKKISVILNNPQAAAIIDIFKENISEMEREISALSTIKAILEKFVSEIEKITAINMNLDLLTDDSVQKMAESLSLIQKNIKESFMSMNELNQASEYLRKKAEKSVHIVYRPPATMVEIKVADVAKCEGKHRKIVEDMAKKFIEETNLFKIKPDMRVFLLADWHPPKYGGIVYITIPDDMEVPEPHKKFEYPGGLYAASTDLANINLWGWIEDNDKYTWDGCDGKGKWEAGWEYFNPFNIHGLDDYDSDCEKDWECSYVTELWPVKEIKMLSVDEKKRITSELDKIILRGKPIEIDLKSLILEKKDDDGICEVTYPNGLMEVKCDKRVDMQTPQQFKAPIKIELRVKMDKANRFFACDEIYVGLFDKDIIIFDKLNDDYNAYKKCGVLSADEFMDVEWVLEREFMAMKVNGELWYYGSDYRYIKELKVNPEYSLGAFCIGAGKGITLTVQSLRVTEI